MGARCQVCASPDLLAIHEDLLTGTPRRRVARTYGLDHSAMDRHWRLHIPAAVRGAAQRAEDSTPSRVDAITGDLLLGLAADQFERARDLLDTLESKMSIPGAVIDVRAVVASLREVRQSVETLAKMSHSVEDRPQHAKASTAPSIDAAIMRALESRGVSVDDAQVVDDVERMPRVLELEPAPST
jgi:hypothetical protein